MLLLLYSIDTVDAAAVAVVMVGFWHRFRARRHYWLLLLLFLLELL